MLSSVKFRNKYNPFEKLLNSLLRRALFRNRDRFHNQNLPSYIGMLNEYISIDILTEGAYDIKSMNEILQVLRSDLIDFKFDTLIDIGANIGNHSVYFSRYFKKVIAFEPNPLTYGILKLNASFATNIEAINLGLSSKPGSLYLSEDTRNLGGSQIHLNKEDIPLNLTVRDINLVRLDDFISDDCGQGILIKIDVEGHELEALEGAHAFISKNNPVICFEQHQDDFIDSSTPTIMYLASMGYEFYLFKSSYDKIKIRFLKPFLKSLFGDSYQLEKIAMFEPCFYDSIIAIHKDSIAT